MRDAEDVERADAAFDRARAAAKEIVADLNGVWQSAGSATRVSFEVPVGADDQPVFTFTLLLDLADDFDAVEWPAQLVESLNDEVRDRVIGSAIDDWDWLVTSRAAASAE